jgi:hypothetical protein
MSTSDNPEGSESPSAIHSVITLPPDSTVITDADEEVGKSDTTNHSDKRAITSYSQIFLLYTELQAAPPHDPANPRGLGFVNSKQDVLELRFDLTAPPGSDSQKPARKRGKKGKNKPDAITSSVEVELLQNTTAFQSRKGDTGSVVWKSR